MPDPRWLLLAVLVLAGTAMLVLRGSGAEDRLDGPRPVHDGARVEAQRSADRESEPRTAPGGDRSVEAPASGPGLPGDSPEGPAREATGRGRFCIVARTTAGQPVVGARVVVSHQAARAASWATDREGRALIPFPGACVAEVTRAGWPRQLVAISGPRTYEITFAAHEGARALLLVDGETPDRELEIQITDERGVLPLEQIVWELTLDHPFLRGAVRVGLDGTFQLRGPPGTPLRITLPRYLAFLDDDGREEGFQRVIRVPERQATGPVALRTTHLRAIAGRLVSSRGTPLAGVALQTVAASRSDAPIPDAGATSAANGSFCLPVADADVGDVLTVRATMHERAIDFPVGRVERGRYEVGDLVVPMGEPLRISVAGATGAPLRAFASIAGSNDVHGGGADGEIVLATVPSGAFDVVVSAPGHRSILLTGCEPGGLERARLVESPRLRVRLEGFPDPAGVAVDLVMKSPTGTRFDTRVLGARSRCAAHDLGHLWALRERPEEAWMNKRTNGAGCVDFHDLPDRAEIVARVSAPGRTVLASKPVAWRGVDVDVVLEHRDVVVVEGRIVHDDGEPASSAAVRLYRDDAMRFDFAADDRGAFSLCLDPDCSFQLMVLTADAPMWRTESLVAADVARAPLSIRLPPPTKAEIVVATRSELLDLVRVYVHEGESGDGVPCTRTRAGRFDVGNPPAWPVEVHVSVGLHQQRERLRLVGETTISLPALGLLNVHVPGFAAFERPWLFLYRGGACVSRQEIASASLITAAPPGIYELVVGEKLSPRAKGSLRAMTAVDGGITEVVLE